MDERVTAAFPDRDVAAVDPSGPSWNDANETARVTFTDGEAVYVKAGVAANRDRLAGAPVALAHGDPAMPNAVWTGTEVALLDWELAYVGDPARDLYRAQDQQFASLRANAPPEIVDAFHGGYRSVAGGLPDGYEERKPIYEAVRLLGASGYVDTLADLLDEPEADLAAWVDAEMQRRLAALT